MRSSIIIPTYAPVEDVDRKLKTCLQVILAYTDMADKELVIVEQGRVVAGNLIQSLKTGRDYPLTYRHSKEPLGFARAVNLGVGLASGDHFLIVNNDIEVSPGWADRLVDKYDSVPNAGLLSPACTSPRDRCEMIEEPTSWWSCVCISRKVWEDVGKLDDEKLNFRLHDQDWSIRCFDKGYVVGRYRNVTVVHHDCTTYKHMVVDETPERAEMVRRYGVEHFADYVEKAKEPSSIEHWE